MPRNETGLWTIDDIVPNGAQISAATARYCAVSYVMKIYLAGYQHDTPDLRRWMHLLDRNIQIQGLDLGPQIFPMIDHMGRAHLLGEGNCLWPRCCGDHYRQFQH